MIFLTTLRFVRFIRTWWYSPCGVIMQGSRPTADRYNGRRPKGRWIRRPKDDQSLLAINLTTLRFVCIICVLLGRLDPSGSSFGRRVLSNGQRPRRPGSAGYFVRWDLALVPRLTHSAALRLYNLFDILLFVQRPWTSCRIRRRTTADNRCTSDHRSLLRNSHS